MMKYLGKLFLAMREIVAVTIMEYALLFLCFIFLGKDRAVTWGSISLILFMIFYVIGKRKGMLWKRKRNDLCYILLGISVSSIFNMLVFKFYLSPLSSSGNFSLFIILASGIVGPIFEETLFRYDLIRRLEKFNSNKYVIIFLDAIIFGLMHFNILNMLYGFIVGLINASIYMRDKDIGKPILVHMAGNIIASFFFRYNGVILMLSSVLLVISIIEIRRD